MPKNEQEKMNWPPEKTIEYRFKTMDEINRDYMEIPLVKGNKRENSRKETKTER